ncbi:uncharacterized protein LOC110621972 isoform X1 [Manihot esculenta]|uniref:Uncharacterized protein n=1 Tax=Manihot esculenta TaxID=3983 RepID=A0A2C9VBZ9_MANES|nr:uncharacterized protein LOC110621972 isoform X1 [Manihot esculenta]OAY42518.1 hypothetical protein MANES_09G186300v8 [Manihot esculenta]
MTMVPAQTLSKQKQQQQQQNHPFYGGYGGCGGGGYSDSSFGLMSRLEEGYDYCISEACLGSDLVPSNPPMAEDESRTNSLNEPALSNSKDNIQQQRDEGWLQLSIGGHTTSHESKHHQVDPTTTRVGLMELDLLPGSSTSQQGRPFSAPIFHVPADEFRASTRPLMSIAGGSSSYTTTSLFFQHQPGTSTYPPYRHQEINWAFRPMAQNIATMASSQSSSSPLMPMGSYLSRPFQVHSGIDVAGPSSDFRIIDPPRSPHSGIWFTLQASQIQNQEPLLPQISKSYLRIKDGRMTVRLLMKYLVNKLKLDSESEVEIRCRGQQLQPYLTMQHVRDSIWSQSPRDEQLTLLPHSSTADHVMVLHYSRTPLHNSSS